MGDAMVLNSFESIIEFAISREKEAVSFYQVLQRIAKFAERKKFLKEIEDMEQTHVAILEDVKANGAPSFAASRIENLKISEQVSAPTSVENLGYQDILILAMKREESSYDLYTQLGLEAQDGRIRGLFERLATEELKHKQYFETIYDTEILREN